MKIKVKQDYATAYGETYIRWEKGSLVEVDEELMAWARRDGAVFEVVPTPPLTPPSTGGDSARVMDGPGADRQQKRGGAR